MGLGLNCVLHANPRVNVTDRRAFPKLACHLGDLELRATLRLCVFPNFVQELLSTRMLLRWTNCVMLVGWIDHTREEVRS